MSTLAKLSKQAAQLEHDRQYQKALTLYARLFDEAAGAEEEVDVALFNRAGDLAMRLGDAERAVGYYERAIDGYAGGGLLNNAIAVCNKVLRHAPDHAATHYTLAVLHAKQGFRGDAKHHYVEYAERMHRAGRDDEAARALGEFAALCASGSDARASLARQLAKGSRGTEMTVRLEAMLADAIPATDAAPSSEAFAAAGQSVIATQAGVDGERVQDLVFLDVSLDPVEPVAPVEGLELTSVGGATAPLAEVALGVAMGVDPLGAESELETSWDAVTPLELDDLAPATDATPTAAPIDFALDEPLELVADARVDEPFDVALDQPLDQPLDVALDLMLPEAMDAEAPSAVNARFAGLVDAERVDQLDEEGEDSLILPFARSRAPRWSTDLPGELPPLSLAGWIGSAEPTVIAGAPIGAPLDAAPAPGVALGTIETTEEFVDLGDWLRASEPAPSTRLTVDDAKPTGDEAADFARLLGAFKVGIARNVDADDHAIHYDLGVAFREMGLIDEAIAEFQRAARAPQGALRAGEAIGQCFLDRGSPELARTTLQRVLDSATVEGGAMGEPSLLGVVYLLGEAHERLGQPESARACFERVVAADIEFRDAARRLSQLTATTP